LMAACSEPAADRAPAPTPEPTDKSADATDSLPPPIKPVDIPTKGGDGSPIELAALTEADISGAKLPGELACSFAADAATPPILLAKGNAASSDPARGVAKIGDTVELFASPGGFDGMTKGARFTGKGMQLRIALTGPVQGGGESPPSPATLTADRADGAVRVFAGVWTCGP
ncbi:hypothetical protein, partial [Sphingopyxis sp. KK2]|uniref:hypothetical protein n=1 Tax=Sphingopyxis sp. KK2 TaxID=1855727 RepID=UPI001C4E1163